MACWVRLWGVRGGWLPQSPAIQYQGGRDDDYEYDYNEYGYQYYDQPRPNRVGDPLPWSRTLFQSPGLNALCSR
jgi:hypothetical protein